MTPAVPFRFIVQFFLLRTRNKKKKNYEHCTNGIMISSVFDSVYTLSMFGVLMFTIEVFACVCVAWNQLVNKPI